jgi:hypothetical protein
MASAPSWLCCNYSSLPSPNELAVADHVLAGVGIFPQGARPQHNPGYVETTLCCHQPKNLLLIMLLQDWAYLHKEHGLSTFLAVLQLRFVAINQSTCCS